MNKKDFTTVRLTQGEMHIYDFGGVKLHAYQTGDPLADEVFLVERAGKFVVIESPCFTASADRASFKAAVQERYPAYSGENYLDMTAGFFFS